MNLSLWKKPFYLLVNIIKYHLSKLKCERKLFYQNVDVNSFKRVWIVEIIWCMRTHYDEQKKIGRLYISYLYNDYYMKQWTPKKNEANNNHYHNNHYYIKSSIEEKKNFWNGKNNFLFLFLKTELFTQFKTRGN